jgi:hypothetical protein
MKIYRTVILPVVFLGVKSFFHFGEHRMRMFENRVLRGIFEPKRDKVIGVRRRLYN